jgi:hypothetical protein
VDYELLLGNFKGNDVIEHDLRRVGRHLALPLSCIVCGR